MAEPGGVEPVGWLAIAGGIVALIGGPKALGAAVKWLTDRAEKRRQSRADGNREWETKLKAWEAKLDEEREATLAECRRHCAEATRHVDKMRVVILLIVPEIERHAPTSPTLKRAKLLLAELAEVLLLPLEMPHDTPLDMAAQLTVIDEKTA